MESTQSANLARDTRRAPYWQLQELKAACPTSESKQAAWVITAGKYHKRKPEELNFSEMNDLLRIMRGNWRHEAGQYLVRVVRFDMRTARKAAV